MGTTSKGNNRLWVLALGLGFGLSALTSVASAAVFDFAGMANNTASPGIGGTELEWQETSFAGGLTIGGITLIASGSNANGKFADAFFDKSWGGKLAGLGVCSTPAVGGGSGCRTGVGSGGNTSDDNVSGAEGGETLTLDFDTSVMFTDIRFRDDAHNLANGNLFINGNLLTLTAGLLSIGDLAGLTGTDIWNFKFNTGSGGTEFYISSLTVSAVPLPAALPLFGTGVGLLGFFGWRKKRRRLAAA